MCATWSALRRECRAGASPAQPPRSLLLAVQLCVNAVLDLIEQRAPLRLPAERARALAARAAVRAETEIRSRPQSRARFADRPVLRLVAEAQHAAERLRHRFEVRLAVLGVEQRASLCLLQRQHIQLGDVGDVHVAPDVQAPPDMAWHAMLARHVDQLRQLHAGGRHADPASVDQGRADHDRAHVLFRRGEHRFVDRDAHRLLRLRLERRVLVEGVVARLAVVVLSDLITIGRTFSFAAASTASSIATRIAFSGCGLNGVSSSKVSSLASPLSYLPITLEPEVWINVLPVPRNPVSSAGTEKAVSEFAALITASTRFATSTNGV